MNIRRGLTAFILCFSLLSNSAFVVPGNLPEKQALYADTVSPTPGPAASSDTPVPTDVPQPTQTPIPVTTPNTPTDSPTLTALTDTPIPTAVITTPAPAETSAVLPASPTAATTAPAATLATEGVTISPTPTPTDASTVTPVPTATASTGISWKVELKVPVTNQQVNQTGGPSGIKAQLEGKIHSDLTDHEVGSSVGVGSSNGSSTQFDVTLSGGDGLGQYRKTVFSDLAQQVDLLGGAVTLDINGNVQSGKLFPLLLESNPTTGYIWKVIGYDSNLLSVTNDKEYAQKGNAVGGTGVQTIRFRGIGNGATTIHLFYGRPWLANAEVDNRGPSGDI